MKAIIPVAGLGTRLRPHTYTAPKALLPVAGKPMLAHILDELVTIGMDEITFIVHHFGDVIEEWVRARYRFKANFILQEELLGLGHAISLTAGLHRKDKEVLIILGDTLFSANISHVYECEENTIGVCSVDDPGHFGIVELEGRKVKRLVEKPENPTTNLAIVGIYHITQPALMYDCLDEIIEEGKTTKGEIQLTDALQKMLDKGAEFRVFEIDGWYDCGKPETLLETNRRVLIRTFREEQKIVITRRYPTAIIKHPVSIHESVTINDSVIGPYVTIDEDVVIENSIVQNSIIAKKATIENIMLDASIVGDNAMLKSHPYKLNVGDSSLIDIG